MKKIAAILLIVFVITSITTIAIGTSVSIRLDGATVQFPDAQPFIDENNRTQIPIGALAEILSIRKDWVDSTQTAILIKMINDTDGDYVKITIGNNEVEKGKFRGLTGIGFYPESTIIMDTAAILKDDRTFIPIRYVAEAFNYTVEWNGNDNCVNLLSGKITTDRPPNLELKFNDNKLNALLGTYSWSFENDDGTTTGIDADSVHPLQAVGQMPEINKTDNLKEIKLEFATAPETISIRRWSDQYIGDVQSFEQNFEIAHLSEKTLVLSNDDKGYIYEVCATWTQGTAFYSFYIKNQDEMSLPTGSQNDKYSFSSISPDKKVRIEFEDSENKLKFVDNENDEVLISYTYAIDTRFTAIWRDDSYYVAINYKNKNQSGTFLLVTKKDVPTTGKQIFAGDLNYFTNSIHAENADAHMLPVKFVGNSRLLLSINWIDSEGNKIIATTEWDFEHGTYTDLKKEN